MQVGQTTYDGKRSSCSRTRRRQKTPEMRHIHHTKREMPFSVSLCVYLCFYGLVYGLISQVNALNDRLTDKLIRLKLNFHCTMIALKLAFQVT